MGEDPPSLVLSLLSLSLSSLLSPLSPLLSLSLMGRRRGWNWNKDQQLHHCCWQQQKDFASVFSHNFRFGFSLFLIYRGAATSRYRKAISLIRFIPLLASSLYVHEVRGRRRSCGRTHSHMVTVIVPAVVVFVAPLCAQGSSN